MTLFALAHLIPQMHPLYPTCHIICDILSQKGKKHND